MHCNVYYCVLSYEVMQQWSLFRYWVSSPTISSSNQILPEG